MKNAIDIVLLVQALTKSYGIPKIIHHNDDVITLDTDEGFVMVEIEDGEIKRIYSSADADDEAASYIQYYPTEF